MSRAPRPFRQALPGLRSAAYPGHSRPATGIARADPDPRILSPEPMHPSLAWQLVGRTAALSQLVLARGQARSAGGAQDLKPGVVAGRTGWGRADAATRRPALLNSDRAA